MKTVILAGGKGTRLWPLSREEFPKQFLKIFNDKSLLQETLERALLFSKPDEVYIVTNEKYRFMVIQHIRELNVDIPDDNVILEPLAKNTLPAIFYGVKTILENSGNDIVAVLPSDHLIKVNDSYIEAFKVARVLAEEFLVTFGIKPNKPHTGYGYIKPGEPLKGGFKVEKFVEKPDYETAKRYVEEGYLWNSGMFMFSTDIFMEECAKHAPEIVLAFEEDVETAYKKSPEISIDYGLMEKTDRAAVVPLDVFWSDVGSFDAIYEIMEKDKNENAVKGEVISIDSRNNLIIGESLIATIGIENAIIVDSGDAILVCSREESQKVRDVVKLLKKRGDKRAEVHRTIYRPWGSFTILEEGQFYKIIKIKVLPKRGLGLRMHYHRSEHWVVVRGTAKVEVDGKEFLLRTGESTFVPAGVKYRLENPGILPLEIIEVQIGEYLGEDDIVRFEEDR